MVLMLEFICIEMAGNDSCGPPSTAHIKQFNVFLDCHFFSLFLGSTSSITSGMSYQSPGVIQGLWYCTQHDEKYTRTWEITLTAICNLLDRRTAAHAEMISVTWPFKWILTIRAHCNSNRWLRNYYSIVYINFMELW